MAPPEFARLALERHFGYRDFRPGQADVVESVLAGHDTLAILPTGGGKSLCYQVPALVLPGLTIVVSPLISLMKDQVDRLMSRGIAAAFVNSTLDGGETEARLRAAQRRVLKVLYLAPERLESARLLAALRQCQVSLIAVDEAHCISEWGHEFRPSFRRLAAISERLSWPQMVALTATATPTVRRDIIRQLRLRHPRVVVGGFDRPNLTYSVRRCDGAAHRGQALLETVSGGGRPSIVYAPTRSAVERVARRLGARGVRASAYHGGLEPHVRLAVQDSFMREEIDTIVATNAFGMGIDKPNVRLVVHYAMPGTLEAYYQEAGRAGRDGHPGRCVLLAAADDRATHEWFIRATFPDRALVTRVYSALRDVARAGHVRAGTAGVARLCHASVRDTFSALRLLSQRGVIVRARTSQTHVRLRLLATFDRIQRELRGRERRDELTLLREVWRTCGARAFDGIDVDLRQFPRAAADVRATRQVLETLRDGQFVHFEVEEPGIVLTRAAASLDDFGIDWDGLAGHRQAEKSKLDRMEEYTRVKSCRRAFLLGYFGEHFASEKCGGCDNCQPGFPTSAYPTRITHG